jgi:glycosyltransferase involved in cell wall biosynthesis
VFQIADVVLFPTRFCGEQHPLVLIEALSSGCIVVTHPLAGITETVDPESAVLLEDGAGIDTLAAATLDAPDHPDRYASMRRRAREFAVARYDWRRQSMLFERIYFSLATH